jgi:hypothetical protein
MSVNGSERMKVLELLEQGKISAAEAAELLSALSSPRAERQERRRVRWTETVDGPPGSPGPGARFVHVMVTDTRTGQVRANVTLPASMVHFGLGFARRFGPRHGHLHHVVEAVRQGRRGRIVDVTGGDGHDRVEIVLE